MSINQNYDLPGVITEFHSEYSSGSDTSLFGTTDSVLIMGTAFNGPTGKVVPVYNPEYGRFMFGGSYDAKTKKESTLMTAVQDCWDRGCRTIYGLRVSGKQISKDYQLGVDTNLKLRVSGFFPSNANKDLSLVVVNKGEDFYIEIFKPASFASMREKRTGVVESANSIIVNRIELGEAGISQDNDIIEVIEKVNSFEHNKAFKLSLVNEEGNDVTYASEDARFIKAGDIFAGLYTIGRDANVSAQKITELNLVQENDQFIKELIVNTDISKDLPIASNIQGKDISAILGVVGASEFEFLKVIGKIDEVFAKDSTDYEEVGISNFELYKRLGSGFAVNAEVKEIAGSTPGSSRYKVVEVADKERRNAALVDGMYSMIESFDVKYRVLAGASADEEIKDRLPRIADFKFAKNQEVELLNGAVAISAKTEEDDLTVSKEYVLSFEKIEDVLEIDKIEDIKSGNNYYFDKTAIETSEFTSGDFEKFKAKCSAEKTYVKQGALFIVTGIIINGAEPVVKLYQAKDKSFQEVTFSQAVAEAMYCSPKAVYKFIDASNTLCALCSLSKTVDEVVVDCPYFTCQLSNGSFVVKEIIFAPEVAPEVKNRSRVADAVVTVGTVEQIFKENQEFFEEEQHVISTSLVSGYGLLGDANVYKNIIKIKSSMFDWLSIDDVVEILKNDKDFSKMFNIRVVLSSEAQETIGGYISDEAYQVLEKTVEISTTKTIPFRTTDIFCRQLAQHCQLTSMRTGSTHGVIGINRLLDTSLAAVSKRVEELAKSTIADELVAKRETGKNMLNKDDLPYEIGRMVSIPVCQYNVRTEDNYTYVSNFAGGYAGMVSTLPLDQSSTLQPARIPAPAYDLTGFQLSKLTAAGFVTVKNSFNKGIVVTDGITMAKSDSPFKRLSANRVTDGCEMLIRKACEPYIGKQNNMTNQNSLVTAIHSELSKIVGVLIKEYGFYLQEDARSAKLGVIKINYTIVPVYEIKQINNSVKVEE